MRDFIGQQLSVGDSVAFTNTYGKSKELNRGVVTGFTNKFVKINRFYKKLPGGVVRINPVN